MKLSKVKNIKKRKERVFDITVSDNHNFFCNGHLIHNCDYRDDVGVILYNTGDEPFEVEEGKAIAQIIFEPYRDFPLVETDILNDIDRGGGFGSTDK